MLQRPSSIFLFLTALFLVIFETESLLAQEDDKEFFDKKVRPIFAERCWSCHSGQAGESKGSLRLDHIELIQKGGDSGPALVARDVDASLIYQAVSYKGYEMPPDGRLPQEQVDTIKEWIARGAYWPDEPLPEFKEPQEAFDLETRRQTHWVWSPRAKVAVPTLAADSWSQQLADVLVLQKLQEQGLEPSEQAPRSTLVRRVYLDLIGIPPTPEELQEAIESTDPQWYAKLVDSLLANPGFGVRWARHWLDLTRFAQSRGHEFDEDIPSAEPYRDYIVRALNADVPYDQFLIEHVAGDMFPSPRVHPMLGWNESILGTGFWHLGD
ncbi:MAG: DUF1549 domain-containing protein, partial [Pirellula sp.]